MRHSMLSINRHDRGGGKTELCSRRKPQAVNESIVNLLLNAIDKVRRTPLECRQAMFQLD